MLWAVTNLARKKNTFQYINNNLTSGMFSSWEAGVKTGEELSCLSGEESHIYEMQRNMRSSIIFKKITMHYAATCN